MVLFKPLPGQEERNTRYLVERKAALRAKSERDVTRNVRILLNSDERRTAMREAMARIGKPDAARDVAALIRTLAARHEMEVSA
jgi:processive 1,2-diacylglycerol beta-glucosyltransferase